MHRLNVFAMLTVLIETHNDEEPLARTLAALVPAAVEGVVRDVIVCDRLSVDHTHRVADQAGCVFVAGGDLQAALRRARCEWILFLEPGARPVEGWMDPVMAHTGKLASPARFTRVKEDRPGFFTRVFSARRPLADGLVMTRRQALALGKSARTAEAMARGLSARRLSGLISPAPVRRAAD